MIKLTNVSKSFDQGKTYVVKDVSFTLPAGRTLVLLGASGCGKTTLLRMMNRLLEPSSGSIEVNKVNIKNADPIQLRRSIGYVFQAVGLFPHMTIEENIAIVLRLKKIPFHLRIKRAHDLLRLVNLEPAVYAKRFPQQLSGGESQRVGVARSLADDPNILLMDEPFGALDAITRSALQEELIHLKQQLQKTIVFVTHDLFEAIRLGDFIAIMNQGRFEQLGTATEIIQDPATAFVRCLIEKISYALPQRVRNDD